MNSIEIGLFTEPEIGFSSISRTYTIDKVVQLPITCNFPEYEPINPGACSKNLLPHRSVPSYTIGLSVNNMESTIL